DKNNKYITEDGINCTSLKNITKFNRNSTNTDTLESLLKEFFQYYSQFDFSTKAVCLNEALPITKPEFSPLYIVNPLERSLNVSKNVSAEEVDRFKMEARNALWALEAEEQSVGNWGLSAIFSRVFSCYHHNFWDRGKQPLPSDVPTTGFLFLFFLTWDISRLRLAITERRPPPR
ncbi:unnamed protein product, partial [Acanthoscelides obtectus]